MTHPSTPSSNVTADEAAQVARANASGKTPVVFVHGLWLLASSWQRWADLFERAGYAPVLPGWPDDPPTIEEARAHPEALAGKSVTQVADHFDEVIRQLEKQPAVIGHSFGGLLTQILAGRGLSAASVAISPAPFRGVLPLPISSLRAASPVLRNPANRRRAVLLTYDQFRYAFANAVDEEQAKRLYDGFHVPAPGKPLFQAAAANLNPGTEVKVDRRNPRRGPLLVIACAKDHTVPISISKSSFKHQQANEGVTEYAEFADRGHAMVIDDGWQEIAETALAFVGRFVS